MPVNVAPEIGFVQTMLYPVYATETCASCPSGTREYHGVTSNCASSLMYIARYLLFPMKAVPVGQKLSRKNGTPFILMFGKPLRMFVSRVKLRPGKTLICSTPMNCAARTAKSPGERITKSGLSPPASFVICSRYVDHPARVLLPPTPVIFVDDQKELPAIVRSIPPYTGT